MSCFSFGAKHISLICGVHVLERGEKIESEQREREREMSSQSHVTAEFPWRQQQCSTLSCSPAQLRAGIRHLAAAAVGCVLPARQVRSLLTEVSVSSVRSSPSD